MAHALRWTVATDPDEVHRLLEASDAAQAERTGTPAPRRRLASTAALVAAGAVHLLAGPTGALATVTLGEHPPFDPAATELPAAHRPRYMQRLAVAPTPPPGLDAGEVRLAGARCLRHVLDRARALGADAVRSEANPDLRDTVALLEAFGFRRYGAVHGEPPGRRWIHLQHTITSPPAGG